MGMLKNFFLDFRYRKDYVSYARYLGATVGDNCKFLSNPRKCFGSEPWLIKIGNHVEITGGVILLTHDGSTWIIREEHPELASWGTIEIGNNVFIGVRSIIMPNVKIGNNVVIGAGSIVTKDVDDGTVVAGIPARVICDVGSFSSKIINKSIPVLGLSKMEQIDFCKRYFEDFYEQ